MKEVPKKQESEVSGGVVPTTTEPVIVTRPPITECPAVPPAPSFPDYLNYQPK